MSKRTARGNKGAATAVPFADPVMPASGGDRPAFEPATPSGDGLGAVIATATAQPVATAPVVVEPAPEQTAEPAAAALPIEAAQTALTQTAEAAATTVQEDVETMATTFENTTVEAPKAFGDVSERAKATLEKSGQIVAEMNEFGKGNVEAVVEASRIALRGFEALGQDAADYGRKSFEGLTATLKSLAAVKSPTEFFKLQSDYMRSSFDQAVAQTSKNTEAMIKLAGDAAQPLSNRMAVAADKVKVAA